MRETYSEVFSWKYPFSKGCQILIKSTAFSFSDNRQFSRACKGRKHHVSQPTFRPESVALKGIINGECRSHPFCLPSHLSSGFNYTRKLSGIKYLAADILQQLPLVDMLISDETSLFFYLLPAPSSHFPIRFLILILLLSTHAVLSSTFLACPGCWIKHSNYSEDDNLPLCIMALHQIA